MSFEILCFVFLHACAHLYLLSFITHLLLLTSTVFCFSPVSLFQFVLEQNHTILSKFFKEKMICRFSACYKFSLSTRIMIPACIHNSIFSLCYFTDFIGQCSVPFDILIIPQPYINEKNTLSMFIIDILNIK